MAIEQNEDGNLIEVELQFNPNGYLSALFGSLDEVQQPLKSFNPAIIASHTQVFDNTINFRNWNYADFPVNYDPCTCEGTVDRDGETIDAGDSELLLNVKIVDEAEITLEGTSQGTLKVDKDPTQANGTDRWDDFYGPVKKIDEAVQAGKKAYKTYSGFRLDLTKEGKSQKVKDGFDNIAGFLTDNVSALKIVPFVSEALAIVDFFVAGGKKDETMKIGPMTMNLEHSFTGDIRSSRPYIIDRAILTPGSEFNPLPINIAANRPLGDSRYPYYNEILGVYTLLEKPQVTMYKGYAEQIKEYTDHLGYPGYLLDKKNIIRRGFKVDVSSIKIAVNEASKLTIKEAYVQLIYSKADTINKFNEGIEGTVVTDSLWVSPLVPLGCLDDRLLLTEIVQEIDSFPWGSPPTYPHGFLYTHQDIGVDISLILAFENNSGDRFLHKATWECEMEEVSDTYEADKIYETYGTPYYEESLIFQRSIYNWFSKPEFENLHNGFFSAEDNLNLDNTTIDRDTSVSEMIVIENSIIEGTAQHVNNGYTNLLAGQSIEILPDSEILPNSDLQVSQFGMNCNVPITLATDENISTICDGGDYQGQKIMAKKIAESSPSILQEQFSFITFPNPADDYLKISLSDNVPGVDEIEITIQDMTGRIVLLKSGLTKEVGVFELETASLTSGVYLMTVRSGSYSAVRKIIIQ